MRRFTGILLVLASAVCFGLMPTFSSWAREGSSLEMMLALRFGIAAVILGGLAIAWRLPMPRGRTLAGLAVMGAVGYFGESYCYFAALKHAPSGLVALLLYLYPVTVTGLAWLLFRERLSTGRITALVLAMIGLLLTLAPMSASRPLGATFLGVALSLAAGVIYAMYILAGSRIAPKVGAIQATIVVAAAASIMFFTVAAIRGDGLPSGAVAWGGVLCLAVVSTVVGISCFFAGLSLVGPVRASTISVIEPVVTVAAGVAFLGEGITWWQVAGGTLILAGAIITAQERPRPS